MPHNITSSRGGYLERVTCVGFARILLNLGFPLPAHIAGPLLGVALASPRGLNCESVAEDVRKLRTETVAAASDLFQCTFMEVFCKVDLG